MPPPTAQDLDPSMFGLFRSREPGTGICPTGIEVRYREELSLERADEWVRYRQRAERADDGTILHEEAGTLRPAPDGGWEVALAMNSGRLEHGRALWEPSTLRTDSEQFFNDRLQVRATRRVLRFDADGIDKELWLATPVWPALRRHMWGRLERV